MQKILLTYSMLFSCFINLSYSQSATISKDENIRVSKLAISIKADQISAFTTLEIELYNPNSKVLDGEYVFSLTDGQIITGFALDINGHMRKGVIVDKQKGRVAYENTIRRRIDPGLLEMTEGNNFRVRVYPIAAKGKRQISIQIHQNLSIANNALQYSLPLQSSQPIELITTTIQIQQSLTKPLTTKGILEKKVFEKLNTDFILRAEQTNILLNTSLAFAIPLLVEKENFVCTEDNREDRFFATRIKLEKPEPINRIISNTVLFWDVSNSGLKRDVEKELKFLSAYLKTYSPKTLTVVTFSNAVHIEKTFIRKNNWEKDILLFFQAQKFDGGTQLGIINCAKYSADEFLLFSDGLSNFGSKKINYSLSPLHTIRTSIAANDALLQNIAASTSGKYINLTNLSIDQGIKQLAEPEVKVTKTSGERITNVIVSAISKNFFLITGKLKDEEDTLFLDIGLNGKIKETKKLIIQKNVCASNTIKQSWITAQALGLKNAFELNEKELSGFGREYNLVTQGTSFIVLDNIQDYIDYGIVPPQDLLAQYKELLHHRQDAQNKNDKIDLNKFLKLAIPSYNNRIQWWNRQEPLIDAQSLDCKTEEIITVHSNTNTNTNDQLTQNETFLKSGNLEEVVVVGYGTQRRLNVTGAVTSISSSQISSATNIFQALEGRVAGVSIIQNNRTLGTSPEVVIRGASSANGQNQPLYILDGFEVDAATVAAINTTTVQSIEVLKDISATALYGSRASNGVILITSRRVSTNNQSSSIQNYYEMEDVEYIEELKRINKADKYDRYFELKDTLGEEPAFYFDVAQHLFEEGQKDQALRVLSNLAEIDMDNHQLLRAMGYVLESWGDFKNAINIYKKILTIKEEEPQSYRDLALAYYNNQEYQKSIDLFYTILNKDWVQYEGRYNGLRAILLNELNAIIAIHKNEVDISKINTAILKPLPVDLRITIDWNKDETDIDLHIKEPGGEECSYSNKSTKNGGRISDDFTQGYGPEEYEIKESKKGTYFIQVNYYGDRYQKRQIPSFIKLSVFQNFGKPNQSLKIASLIMDKQTGKIEIGKVRYKE